MHEAQKKKEDATKVPRRSSPARLGNAIRVSDRNGQSYAEILKEMEAKANPIDAGLEASPVQYSGKN